MSNGAYRGIFINDFAPGNVPMPVPTTVPARTGSGGLIDLASDVIGGILVGGISKIADYQFGQGGLVDTNLKLVPVGATGQAKHRHMNVCNPRALRRSMRRVQGFARFAKKTISFTKQVKMKKRRR